MKEVAAMAPSSKVRSFLLVALIVIWTFVPGAQAQQGKAQDKKAIDEAKKVAEARKKAQEAALVALHYEAAKDLREAYIVLASANHNYGGHDGKAGDQVLEAVKILDKFVLRKGNAAQKTATNKENAAVAAAKAAAARAAAVNQPQIDSDAKLVLVSDALTKISVALAANNVKGPHQGHVNKAIREITEALKKN
jgi:hypothetical protein